MTGGDVAVPGWLDAPVDDPAVMSEVTTELAAVPRRIVFLEWLRAIAAPIVMYSHVVRLFLAPRNNHPWIAGIVDDYVTRPLHLSADFGNVGVVVFFLVSGFIVSHTGVRESLGAFTVKRLLRIYPPLMVTVLLAAGIHAMGGTVLETGQSTALSAGSILSNITLVNYLLVPQVVLVAVGWTLIIEVLFYLLLGATRTLLRDHTGWTILGELALVGGIMLTASMLGANYFLFAVAVSYLPALLLGQSIWALWSGRVPAWAGLLLIGGCWCEYVVAGVLHLGRLNDAYDLTLALCTILFGILLLAEPRLRPNRVATVLADRSYSLYLLHGVVAFPVMAMLYRMVPSAVAVLAGIVVTAVAVEASYRAVERPSQLLARYLLTRRPAADDDSF